MTDAWAQVVDCRRMLKWTYAFGYYRFADQTAASKPQQEFFEFNQVGSFAWLSLATLCPIAHINLSSKVMCMRVAAHWRLVCF